MLVARLRAEQNALQNVQPGAACVRTRCARGLDAEADAGTPRSVAVFDVEGEIGGEELPALLPALLEGVAAFRERVRQDIAPISASMPPRLPVASASNPEQGRRSALRPPVLELAEVDAAVAVDVDGRVRNLDLARGEPETERGDEISELVFADGAVPVRVELPELREERAFAFALHELSCITP